MNNHQQELNWLVEEAVRSYPLDKAPESLLSGAMKRIQKPARFTLQQLSWLDTVFSLVLGLMGGAALFLIQHLTVTPYWTARLKMELVLFYQQVKLVFLHHQPEVAALLVGFSLVLIMVPAMAWLYRRQLVAAAV